ncbi:MAG: T9SS type A sorting domain-containing protein [Saprospiraceae bacterium]|nr:T9SS type A sorting domain-containing protein [Saprospiraceae bacterium]
MKNNHLFGSILLGIILGLYAFTAHAQTSCGGISVGTNCLKYPSQTYQCVSGNYNSPSLYGTALLSPAQALNTPQYLLVKGYITFTGDYTFAQGSNIVFLDNNSGFKVDAGAQLTLEKSDLNGCSQLWAGVEVLFAGSIRANSCTFEDAKAAIIMRNAATIEATYNVFRKNYCGIVGVSSNTNPGISSSVLLGNSNGISGNLFLGNDELLEVVPGGAIISGLTLELPVHSTKRPYAGIWLERIQGLTIGHLSDAVTSPVNVFRDFGLDVTLPGAFANVAFGIRANQTNLTVKNSEFENMGVYIPGNPPQSPVTIRAAAIFASNFSLQMYQTNVQGLVEKDMFKNCYFDVYTVGTNLSVTGINSRRSYNSINASTASSLQAPISVLLKKNKIDYFRKTGILIRYFRAITIEVENNKIFDNDQLNDPVQRLGIVLSGEGTQPEIRFRKGKIINNQIKSRSRLLGGEFYGISIFKSSYLEIERNSITDEDSPSNLSVFAGIVTALAPCNGLSVRYNSIKGAGIGYGTGFGILILNTKDCLLTCNYTDNVNAGIAFIGICDNTDLKTNNFNHHAIGLAVGHPDFPNAVFNQIGLQQNKENRWVGNSSTVEAYALNQASALASIFKINSTNFNSVFWPSPRLIGNTNDNGLWFMLSNIGPPAAETECLIEESFPIKPGFAENDFDILSNSYEPPLGFAALDWEARWDFADRLSRNPALQSFNNQVAAYYQATHNSTYSTLNSLYQAYINRWHPDGPIAAQSAYYYQNWSDAVQLRFEKENMLTLDPVANASVHAQLLQADEQIQNWADSLSVALGALNALVNQETAAALSELENTSCQEAYEEDMKKVLRVFMQAHFQQDAFSAPQLAQLSTIADKCRYSGGYAVVLARSAFEPQNNYPQDAGCQLPQLQMENGTIHNATDVVSIFPNPTSNVTHVAIRDTFEQGHLRIYNTQGILLRSQALETALTEVSLHALDRGIYILEVSLDGKLIAGQRIVKIQ